MDDIDAMLQGIDDDGEQQLTPTEIYELLTANEELILTIPAHEEDRLRKGLASAKNKMNAKLKDSGLPADTRMLQFHVQPSKDQELEDHIDIQISLASRASFKIKRIQLPDPEL